MKKNNNSYLWTEECEYKKYTERPEDEPLFELTQSRLCGLGGWLIYFQFRIYAGAALSIASFFLPIYSDGAQVIIILTLLFLALCLVMFYRKDINFRVVYIIATVFNEIMSYAVSHYLTLSIIIEAVIIAALFKSERVKNTFR